MEKKDFQYFEKGEAPGGHAYFMGTLQVLLAQAVSPFKAFSVPRHHVFLSSLSPSLSPLSLSLLFSA